MPQGAKKPSQPVSTNRQAGTFKKGGKVTPAEGNLMKACGAEDKTAMKQAKAQSNEVYSKYQKMADGGRASGEGAVSDRERKIYDDLSKGAYDAHYANEKADNEADRKAMIDAMMYMPRQAKKGMGAITDEVLMQASRVAPNLLPKLKELRGKGQGSVTETEKSITVSPAGKKRGGRAC